MSNDTEYGGADTARTAGVQPAPHVLTADEKLRVAVYATPADDPGSLPPAGLDPLSASDTGTRVR